MGDTGMYGTCGFVPHEVRDEAGGVDVIELLITRLRQHPPAQTVHEDPVRHERDLRHET
jgi:hypothetical protein